MTKEEQAMNLIAKYSDLLRIKVAENKDTEVNNQINTTKAQLQALGVVIDDLVIERG